MLPQRWTAIEGPGGGDRFVATTDRLVTLGSRVFYAGTRALVPGPLRQRGVAVGRHEAPTAPSLPRFMARWQEVYGKVRRGEASVVALAAAHHRLADNIW